jgi:hypothetical protein
MKELLGDLHMRYLLEVWKNVTGKGCVQKQFFSLFCPSYNQPSSCLTKTQHVFGGRLGTPILVGLALPVWVSMNNLASAGGFFGRRSSSLMIIEACLLHCCCRMLCTYTCLLPPQQRQQKETLYRIL